MQRNIKQKDLYEKWDYMITFIFQDFWMLQQKNVKSRLSDLFFIQIFKLLFNILNQQCQNILLCVHIAWIHFCVLSLNVDLRMAEW